MNIEKFESGGTSADDGLDDLQKLLRRVEAERPEVREGREDLRELHKILDELVALRKVAGLSQKDVAVTMGVKQPTISQFETETSDPKISTLQRYARAVGTQLCMSVGPRPVVTMSGSVPVYGRTVDFSWSAPARVLTLTDSQEPYLGGVTTQVGAPEQAPLPVIAKALAKAIAADSHRADFALTA